MKPRKRGNAMRKNCISGFGVLFFVLLFLPLLSIAASEKQVDSPKTAMPLVADPGAYLIGSGDVLEVLVWKEENLTREVFVRLDGKITFPLLDDIQAAGRTPLQLKHNIQEKLAEFVESPSVTVTLKASGSQKFYILGEVARTGEYPLVKDLTVLQAFALAGGFTEWASKKEILLFRDENGTQKTIRINYKEIANAKDFSQNVPIKANDTIIVP
jgi:polysaccharide biosynthesis/export protein